MSREKRSICKDPVQQLGLQIIYLIQNNELDNQKKLSSIKILLSQSASVEEADIWGHTALHLAVREGYLEIVSLLLKHGASPNSCNILKRTPLYFAAQRGFSELTELLLKYGADPEITDKFNRKPIDYAYSKLDSKILKKLKKDSSNNSEIDALGNDNIATDTILEKELNNDLGITGSASGSGSGSSIDDM